MKKNKLKIFRSDVVGSMLRPIFLLDAQILLKEGKILVVKDLAKVEPKTTKVAKMLENLKIKKEILLVLPQKLENVFRAARNIAQINLAQADLLNTYEVLNGGQILLMAESIEKLEEVFLGKKIKKHEVK